MMTFSKGIAVFFFAVLAGGVFATAAEIAPLLVPLKAVRATASSFAGENTPAKAIDGIITDQSRWVSGPSANGCWLEIELDAPRAIGGIHLYSGFKGAGVISDFAVQCWKDGRWVEIPSGKIQNNSSPALAVAFDDTFPVNTQRLRLSITRTHQNIARVLEVVIWPATREKLPAIPNSGEAAGNPSLGAITPIYLNQSGFNLGKPKRFTVPTLADGTRFEVRAAAGGDAVFSGTINGHVGDFTSFNPQDARDYVVAAGGMTSVPFRIGDGWLERVTYQNAVNFMIDSRHYVGTYRPPCRASFGWRDDHHYGWELTTLVPQYLSNPAAYERMPRQVNYEAPSDPKLWGKLEPYRADAPDVVKLIHWGTDVIVTQGLTHQFLKAQLAYFLYAWPWLKPYLPEQNYRVAREFAFAHWADKTADHDYFREECTDDHNLLAVKTTLGSTKGGCPPGYSVEPNLLMYEVAKREHRPDADQYLQAALRQAEWMIAHLDWNDPMTTKGQRQSEFITVTGLAHLLRDYPERAPAELSAKLNAWAEVVVRRSNNMWDFRKLDDGVRWVPTGDKPTMWNEVGNVVGLPASLLAAQPFVKDPAIRARFDQLIWSHLDNAFGRNPTGRHFSNRAPKEIEGVEHGWFTFHPGGIAQLGSARFVLDGAPKDAHYPYHPEKGEIGWTEGWVQFNTPFNLSLAYLAFSETKVTVSREGGELLVRLDAPLNFDYQRVETATVTVTTNAGDEEKVSVTEVSPNSRVFLGRIPLESKGAPVKGDGKIQAASGTMVEAAYGFGFFARRAGQKVE